MCLPAVACAAELRCSCTSRAGPKLHTDTGCSAAAPCPASSGCTWADAAGGSRRAPVPNSHCSPSPPPLTWKSHRSLQTREQFLTHTLHSSDRDSTVTGPSASGTLQSQRNPLISPFRMRNGTSSTRLLSFFTVVFKPTIQAHQSKHHSGTHQSILTGTERTQTPAHQTWMCSLTTDTLKQP